MTAAARQLFVVVERDAARLRMRIVPIQDDAERVAVANSGLGIVPLEALGSGDHQALIEAYHVFRQLDFSYALRDGDERLASAFAAWKKALAPAGLQLRLERRALYGARVPHANWRMDDPGVSVRPLDVELIALSAGLRAIVKLDHVPRTLIERLRHTASERGLRVEIVAPQVPEAEAPNQPPQITILVGREASTLERACEVESLLLLDDNVLSQQSAVLEMGMLLGYPPCCVERFTRIAEQNDTTLAWALLPGAPHLPAPPLTQWLQPGLALVSHAPCDLHCAHTIALGQRILDVLDAQQPGFDARWRSLASRVQVIDHHGNRLAMAVDDELEAGGTITAVDVLADGGSDSGATATAQRLVGRVLAAECGGLVIADGDWYAPYVADHRGGS